MTNLLKSVVTAFAVLALGACATYKDTMPAWMPGSSAVSVKLTGAEEVPPVNAKGSGSGSLRLAEDGTVKGSVTTKDVQGTMAHIHQGAKGQNGPVIVPLTKSGDTYSVPPGRKLTDAQMKAFKARSEERRVGKEGRSRWSPYHQITQ